MKALHVLAAAIAVLSAAAAPAAGPPVVRIALPDSFEQEAYIADIAPTVSYLQEVLPQYRFEVVTVSSTSPGEDVAASGVSFFFGSAAGLSGSWARSGWSPLAVQESPHSTDPMHSTASAFVVRSESPVRSIADLKGLTAVAEQPNAFTGWLVAMGEIARRGLDWRSFFRDVRFVHFQVPDVTVQVLSGAADVGILSACRLEEMVDGGLVDPSALRVLEPRQGAELACRHSTETYPGTMLSYVDGVSRSVLRDVTVAILGMPEGEGPRWAVTNGLSNVDSLYRALEAGPYAYLHDNSLKALARKYLPWILMALAAVLFLLVNQFLLRHLVRRRTVQLTNSLIEKERIAREAAAARERISRLEKISLINQVGSLIAHELKQPVASVINYAAGLKIRSRILGIDDELLARGITNISDEAKRVARIVDRVRSYAKKQAAEQQPMNLADAVSDAVKTYRRHGGGAVRVSLKQPARAVIMGDAFGLTLMILNLVKNAGSAAAEVSRGAVSVTVGRAGPCWRLSVKNNGRRLTADDWQRLMSASESLKPDGLGLGLSIAGSIAAEHSTRLAFARRDQGGLNVTVDFEALSVEDENA